MPIKYKDYDTDPDNIDTTPIVEKLGEKTKTDAVSDMMTNIIEEKQKMKNTAMMDMAGVLTPVKYYQKVGDYKNNYNVGNSQPNSISINLEKYYEIKDFKVKLTNSVSLEEDGDEDNKSYITTGNLIILPRTIKPNEGDIFIMKYYQRTAAYMISKVDIKSYEEDSGFECEFTLYKENFVMDPNYIVKTYNYIQELVGTSYRPILTSNEYSNLKKYEDIYNRLSSIFNNLFYDKQINGYFLKNSNNKPIINENINNINTLKSRNGLYQGNSHREDRYMDVIPRRVNIENVAYDNLLNRFMSKNKIFRDFEGLMLSTESVLPLDRLEYKKSIYGCIETRTVSNYKNIIVYPVNITLCRPNVPAYFVGKINLIHVSPDQQIGINTDEEGVFPKNLTNLLINGKNIDMITPCTKKAYGSIDEYIIETIARFVYKQTDDFVDRFNYLYLNMDNLYDDNISYQNIFYLFPLLGYVIEHIIEEMYDDNIFLR